MLISEISVELILILFAILLLIIGATYLLMRQFFQYQIRSLTKHQKRLENTLDESKKYYEAEIKRSQFLLQHNSQNAEVEQKTDNIAFSGDASHEEVTELVRNKQSLEREMESFQRKNKKLWEQSLAIHKEKERIDGLKKEIETKHKELTDSIHYAKRIQGALLPKKEAIDTALQEYFILWRPRDIVSGDFYWIRQVDHYSIIVAADCTGHGVPGGFMSMLGIAFLNEVVTNLVDIKANEILDQLRELVKISLQQSLESRTPSDGMDMAICIIDNRKKELQFAGANNPLVYLRDDELHQLKPTRNPIAIYRKEKPFQLNTLQLQKGDQFYIFSDGYVDQFGDSQDIRYTIRRFKDSLLEIQHLPMSEQKAELESRLEKWQGERKQLDDILVIGFKV